MLANRGFPVGRSLTPIELRSFGQACQTLRMFIFDAHLDLSMNALEWNRDITRPLDEIRKREAGQTDKKDRGNGTVCLPEMRAGGIGRTGGRFGVLPPTSWVLARRSRRWP